MKKKILFFALCIGAFAISAQTIADNAIGIRFGGNNGFGGEISYQRKISSANRLEVDLGLYGNSSYSAFKATGLYQWVFPLPDLDENVNWYVGAGGGLGNWATKSLLGTPNNSEFFLFGAGAIGIEYNFDIPLLISLDFRPEIGFSNVYKGFHSNFGLGVRYQF